MARLLYRSDSGEPMSFEFGPEHPDTLGSINNLARTLLDLGETAAAHDLVTSILPQLPTLTHAEARKALTALARRLNLLPPEAP